MFMSDFFAVRRGGFGDRHSLVRVGLALCLAVVCLGVPVQVSYATPTGPGKLVPMLVKDINPGIESTELSLLTITDNTILFSASDTEHGRQVWKTDGTVTGTIRLTDVPRFLPMEYFDFGQMGTISETTLLVTG